MPATRLKPVTMLNAVSATTTGSAVSFNNRGVSFQATGILAASTGTAVINIMVSNNNSNWMTLGSITLSLTTSAISDGFDSAAGFAYYRADIHTINAAGSTLNVYASSVDWG